MSNLFEEYLKEQHAKSYHGTDDAMLDAFRNWLANLDTEEIMLYADAAILEGEIRGLTRGEEIALNAIRKI